MRYLLVISLLLVLSSFSSAQNDGRNRVHLNVGGTTGVFGVSYQRVLNDNISVTIGAGSLAGIGIKHHTGGSALNKKSHTLGYSFVVLGMWQPVGIVNYLPIGYSIGNKVNFSFDLGPAAITLLNEKGTGKHETTILIWGNLQIGYRF